MRTYHGSRGIFKQYCISHPLPSPPLKHGRVASDQLVGELEQWHERGLRFCGVIARITTNENYPLGGSRGTRSPLKGDIEGHDLCAKT